jgi:hypothetical protein
LNILKSHRRKTFGARKERRFLELQRGHKEAPTVVSEWLAMFPKEELEQYDRNRLAREEALYQVQRMKPEKDLKIGLSGHLIMKYLGRDSAPRNSAKAMNSTLITSDRPRMSGNFNRKLKKSF